MGEGQLPPIHRPHEIPRKRESKTPYVLATVLFGTVAIDAALELNGKAVLLVAVAIGCGYLLQKSLRTSDQ